MPKKFVKISSKKFGNNYYVKNWDEKRQRKMIADSNSEDTLIISDRHDLFMATDVVAAKVPFRNVHISQSIDLFNFTDREIEMITSKEGFVSCYLYNDDYTKQQSAISESDYHVFEIPLDLADNLPYSIDYTGLKDFDITSNPGRNEVISYTKLNPAWKMWFGNSFYNIVSKDRILSFPEAFKIRELNDGRIFVQLFEKIEDSSSKENQEKQWAWRKWLDFDSLLEKYR